MDGIYFYWLSWIGWVLTTFFMNKTRERTYLSFTILLAIISSTTTFQIGWYPVRLTFFPLFLYCLMSMTKKRGPSLYIHVFYALIVAIGYVAFHLFELFDPVWLIVDRRWLLAFALVYLTLLLVKDKRDRFTIAVIGACNGEVLYSLILSNFGLPIEIGSFQYLDSVAIICFFILLWNVFEWLAVYFEATFYKGIKERQG